MCICSGDVARGCDFPFFAQSLAMGPMSASLQARSLARSTTGCELLMQTTAMRRNRKRLHQVVIMDVMPVMGLPVMINSLIFRRSRFDLRSLVALVGHDSLVLARDCLATQIEEMFDFHPKFSLQKGSDMYLGETS